MFDRKEESTQRDVAPLDLYIYMFACIFRRFSFKRPTCALGHLQYSTHGHRASSESFVVLDPL